MTAKTMIAIAVRSPGGPEMLVAETRAIPSPGPGQLLIKVAAAGVNRPDILQRMGRYPPPDGASDLPGLEVAGTVVALGDDVSGRASGFARGDAVCALLPGGGYAGFAVADAGCCLPVPSGLSMVEAASLPETAFTVWTNLVEGGRFRPGEHVLVHGGTSGIGVMAIQMVRALGGTVYATAGSPEKARTCEALGAACGIDYREQDFVAQVHKATGGTGVDIVLDMVGGDYLARNMDACAVGGRIVMIAFLKGAKPPILIPQLMAKRIVLTGSTLRSRSSDEKAKIARALRREIWPLVEAGRIRPVIDSRYPLRESAAAHRRMENAAHIGKIVLEAPA